MSMSTDGSVQSDLQNTLEKLVPRRYQEEVFERAQNGNIIAALDTGSGKTLISLLLIKWITSLEKSRGKVVIFLVPKVTLVEQQYAYIKKNSSLTVVKLHGAQDLDLSDREGWRARFEGCDVLVMTAQIFLNIMTHSLWTMSRVSLMVFDECHHARKNHPYNGILREYFQQPVESRPKIFGMTASPIWNVKDPIGSLAALEANLDAKVTAVREHVDELVAYSPRALELIKKYPFPPETYPFPSPTIHDCLSVISRAAWDQLDIPWTNIEMRYTVTFNNLGPYCASLFIYQEIQHHVSRVIAEHKHSLIQDQDDVEMDGILPVSTVPSFRILPDDFFLIIDILLDFHLFFPTTSPSKHTSVPLDWCTPKLRVLVDILDKYHGHTPTFQCIIFVEQRQVASSLSAVLPNIPELRGKIQCAHLVGTGVNSEGVSKHSTAQDGDPVKLFREHKINILIATDVAEEGLDFKECDLVVRYDPLHHMIGYVQSRGRARKQGSTFIVMIQENDTSQLEKYRVLQEKEPEVNHVYRTRHTRFDRTEEEDIDVDDDDADPADLLERERYVVPSTGAVLNYDNCLTLLNLLCSLIPRDPFTLAHVPQYTGDFQVKVQLPRSLPLSAKDLTYTGPPRRSKKEARRAVAFMAVKRLRELDVFDEYLLPTAKHSEEQEGTSPKKAHRKKGKGKGAEVPVMLNVGVQDPWCMGEKLWLHPIAIDSRVIAGLVTGTNHPPEDVMICGQNVQLLPAKLLEFSPDSEHEKRAAMQQYTKHVIWTNITSSPFSGSLSFYVIPIKDDDYEPDFSLIDLLVDNYRGISDWSQITEDDYDKLIVFCSHRQGSIHLLRRIRHDLTPRSKPLEGSREDASPTYQEYWINKWSNPKRGRQAIVGPDGPILEVSLLPRSNDGTHSIDSTTVEFRPVMTPQDGRLLPQSCCTWLPFSYSMRRVYEILPELCHRITNTYRASRAQFALALTGIPKSLITEAFTIPSATMPFSNQRLETLGDAVLQVCTTVHLMNKYPNRHEGQLTRIRQQYVSNQSLMRRALDIGLERFVNSELPSVYKWRYTLSDDQLSSLSSFSPTMRSVLREYPRRSLQDCVEAILGAAFIAGGISLALQIGTSLGLQFGGPLPWFMRYPLQESTPIPSVFTQLQADLGYQFRRHELLLESITHPSFTNSEVPSYQRLEFLGDAILDLVTMKYLFDKFPNATSHQLSLPRMRAICAPTLANLAVRRLGLHKVMLVNNMDLTFSIDRFVPVLEQTSGEEIVRTGWKFDPPKALSDVFESIIGAVLIDSGYDYEKTAAVVEYVMDDVLEALSPDVDKDPVSELTEWASGSGCRMLTFAKRLKEVGLVEKEGIVVLVHDVEIIRPVFAASVAVAKFTAAARALAVLRDNDSEKSLASLCNCGNSMDVTEVAPTHKGGSDTHKDDLSDDLKDIIEVSEILTRMTDSSCA